MHRSVKGNKESFFGLGLNLSIICLPLRLLCLTLDLHYFLAVIIREFLGLISSILSTARLEFVEFVELTPTDSSNAGIRPYFNSVMLINT